MPARRLPGPDYWLRKDTLVEPPIQRRLLEEETRDQDGEPGRPAGSGGHGLRWVLLLVALLVIPVVAAWALSQPGLWRRLDAPAHVAEPAQPAVRPSLVPPVTVADRVDTPPPEPEPAQEPPRRDARTAPERLAAARAVPRNPRCALLIRTAQLGVPMEVTDLAYLSRACAAD